MTLDELLKALPKPGDLPEKMQTEAAQSILQPAPSPLHYIDPNLLRIEGDPTTSSVILVEAAAAVGKTSLAHRVSSASGNPVWDLSRLRLGSNVFSGTLLKAYGAAGYVEFEQMIRDRKCCLILDAADEAFVGSGAKHFQEAVKDLKHLAQLASGPAALILGRFDTITDAGLFLLENGFSICRLQVDFFTRPQAERFFMTKVKNAAASEAAVIEFLDKFFTAVQDAFGQPGDWDRTRQFIGYAPVLDSLVSFFRNESDGNPYSVLQGLRDRVDGYIWNLLSGVIESILTRDQDKFAVQFSGGGSDQDKLAFAKKVYSPVSQIEILMSDAPMEYEPEAFHEVPADIRVPLREALNRWLREHPLLLRSGEIDPGNPLQRFSNVAFRDYALAMTILSAEGDSLDLAIAYAAAADFNPSPMLSRFLFSNGLLVDHEKISPSAIGIIVDSHSSRVGSDSSVLWISDEDAFDAGGNLNGEISLELLSRDAARGQLRVGPVGAYPLIELNRGVSFCTIDMPTANIVCGGVVSDFIAGPSVAIVCDTLTADVDEFRVSSSVNASDGVRIKARRIKGGTRTVYDPGETLTLHVPSVGHPWNRFIAKENEETSEYSYWDVYLAGMDLRRLVSWFTRKSQRGGGLRYLRTPMDSILDKGRAPFEMFEYCRSSAALTVSSTEYLLSFNFSVPVIFQVDLNDANLYDFLTGYLDWVKSGD